MSFTLQSIVLWSRNARLAPVVLTLAQDQTNILVGDQKTGKSSLLQIIDYCLGCRTLNVPLGIITDTTQAFGLTLRHDSNFLSIVRDATKGRTQFYLLDRPCEAMDLSEIAGHRSVGREEVKQYIFRLLNISRIDFDIVGFGRPSYRDLLLLNFQAQFILVNPSLIFFKETNNKSVEKLSHVLPELLGIRQGSLETFARIKEGKIKLDKIKARGSALLHESGPIRERVVNITHRIRALLGDDEISAPQEPWSTERYIKELHYVLRRNQKVIEAMARGNEPAAEEAAALEQRLGAKWREPRVAFLLGQLHEILESSELLGRLDELRAQYLEEKKRTNDVRPVPESHSAETALTSAIHVYAQAMQLDRLDWQPFLDFADLKLKFHSPEHGIVDLARVGSEQNYIGYHIATHLAVHERLIASGCECVPRFLVIDQPSQYFWSAREAGVTTEESRLDGSFFPRLFAAVAAARERTGGRLQVLILEHPTAIGELCAEKYHLVAQWRRQAGEGLVPANWRASSDHAT